MLDDEPQMRKALRRLLTTYGFRVEAYETGREYLAAMETHPTDCLVLDLHMPEMNGFEVLEAFAHRHVRTPVVVVTADAEPDTQARVLALGASAYLTKPVDESMLVNAIRMACANVR